VARKRSILSSGYYHGLSLNQISHIQILDKSGGRNVTLHTFDKSILQFSRKFLYVFIKFLERRATLHTFGSPLPILI